MAPRSSVPVSSWGISAQHAERLGWPEPSRSQGGQEGHEEDGGVDEPDRQEKSTAIEREGRVRRQFGEERPSKPIGNSQADRQPSARDQRRFDQHAGEDLRRL